MRSRRPLPLHPPLRCPLLRLTVDAVGEAAAHLTKRAVRSRLPLQLHPPLRWPLLTVDALGEVAAHLTKRRGRRRRPLPPSRRPPRLCHRASHRARARRRLHPSRATRRATRCSLERCTTRSCKQCEIRAMRLGHVPWPHRPRPHPRSPPPRLHRLRRVRPVSEKFWLCWTRSTCAATRASTTLSLSVRRGRPSSDDVRCGPQPRVFF